MIESKIDTEESILYLYPKPSLEKEDFIKLSKKVDPFINDNGLRGIIVRVDAFPGWENLGAFSSHIHFVKDHQKRVEKIAIVTDSKLGNMAEHLAKHFVAAKVKHFPAAEIEQARKWVLSVID